MHNLPVDLTPHPLLSDTLSLVADQRLVYLQLLSLALNKSLLQPLVVPGECLVVAVEGGASLLCTYTVPLHQETDFIECLS